MTLILGMSKDEGIYLSTDYRVTDARTGELIDDASTKFLHALYPPLKSGPSALIAYTGLAILRDGTPTGTWIRETLRGETEVFDDSMAHLLDRADRDIAPLRVPLIINTLVIQGARRWFGGVTNVAVEGRGTVTKSSFEYLLSELHEPFAFASGSGATRVIADRHLDLVRSQLAIWPRKTLDHMRLLATVNRRVAERDPAVSPFCKVSFVNADDRTSPISHAFLESDEEVPFEMPLLIYGADFTSIARRVHERGVAFQRGELEADWDPSGTDEEQKRRP